MSRLNDFINEALPKDIIVGYDTKIFGKLVNFVTGLEPDQLTTNQNGEIADIISAFNMAHKDDATIEEDANTGNKLSIKFFPDIQKYSKKHGDH